MTVLKPTYHVSGTDEEERHFIALATAFSPRSHSHPVHRQYRTDPSPINPRNLHRLVERFSQTIIVSILSKRTLDISLHCSITAKCFCGVYSCERRGPRWICGRDHTICWKMCWVCGTTFKRTSALACRIDGTSESTLTMFDDSYPAIAAEPTAV